MRSNLETSNMTRLPEYQEEEAEVFQEVVVNIEVEQEVEEVDPSTGEGADPHGMNPKTKNGMMGSIGGMSPKKLTQNMMKIENMKEKEGLEEKMRKKKNMKEDMKAETKRGQKAEADPPAKVRTAECNKKIVEDLAAEPDPTAQEGMGNMKMIEKVTEEGQQRPADIQVETMKQRIEGKMMTRKEQEAHLPEEGDTGKIAPTMTMNMKEEEEEAEGVAHQKQDIEEEIPATTNEGGAQGP